MQKEIIMENIQHALISAAEGKPSEFKSAIEAEIQAKVYDAIANRKLEMAGTLFTDEEEYSAEEEDEFQSSSEENVDEDL
jgi:hypothetical protein